MGWIVRWRDAFAGPELDPHWVGGHLNRSAELRLRVEQGLRFAFDAGREYASAGVVLRDPLQGSFRAELHFEVQGPAPGTTFELAAIQVAPPATTGLPPDQFEPAHRVFNVHGAPPYVSSEFDEDDGWRIGWNAGDRQGGWHAQDDWHADNQDNRYGRNVGGPFTGPASGWLSLERLADGSWRSGGRLTDAAEWLPTGQRDHTIAQGPVHLRIVAKHWVKTREQRNVAPANTIVIRDFRLYTEDRGEAHALDGQ
ncbi:hypothetical protein [Pseudorhodoferax sp.]|uniref:hypothetical protein n=1 Tax=Pseudorhodoferax sp. TaxID=1993553 RepID=UPI002DD67ED5|nr:hypothetical protein [Pseudorhodoferax sp.]